VTIVTPVDELVISLTAAIAAAAGLSLADDNTGQIRAHEAVEGRSAAVYTVIRLYGGNEPGSFVGSRRRARVLIQADTRGAIGPDVLRQAWAVHEALLDAGTGSLRQRWIVPAKRANDSTGAIEAIGGQAWVLWVRSIVTVPGVVAVDEVKRKVATGNFEIQVRSTPGSTAIP
jgi:hypothetical protein